MLQYYSKPCYKRLMKRKLKVSDPKFFHKIGKLGGDARKAAGTDYSALARLSHKNRDSYNGGRPKGSKNKKKTKKEK